MKSQLVAQSALIKDAFDQHTVSATLVMIRQDMFGQLAGKPSAYFVVHNCQTLAAFAVGADTNCFPAVHQIVRLVYLIDCNFGWM